MQKNTAVLESVTRPYVGQVLPNKVVIGLVIESDAAWASKVGSLNIADHCHSAKQATQYADTLFDRVPGGLKVRATEDITRKPASVRGARGVDPLVALAAFKAGQAAKQDAEIAELEALTAPE